MHTLRNEAAAASASPAGQARRGVKGFTAERLSLEFRA